FNVRIAVTPNALGQWEGGVSHEGQDSVNCGIPPERYSCLNELTGLARAARRACALTINNAKVSAMAPVTGNIHQAISVLIVSRSRYLSIANHEKGTYIQNVTMSHREKT